MNRLFFRLLMFTMILALLVGACSSPFSNSRQATPTGSLNSLEPTPTTSSPGMIDVGGYKLYFWCIGQGSPTVILEAGHGSGAGYLVKVQSGGDRSYRVCSYDRANIPPSDKAPKPRTYLDIARDLHTLLVNAQIDGPFILVGHSGGGLMARLFVDLYPDEVAGLVLVDSAHPDMGSRLLAGLPPKKAFEARGIRAWRTWLTWMVDSHGSSYRDEEGVDTAASNAQVKAAKPLGDLPLVVISRSPDNPNMEDKIPLPAETNVKLQQIWQDLQNELAGWSTNSTHLIAAHAGHNIPGEEPELVIAAIRKLVNEFRSQSAETALANTASPTSSAERLDGSDHTPIILRVAERTENRDGVIYLHRDVYFKDLAGDAATLVNKVVAYDLHGYHPRVSDDIILAPADEQKRAAYVTSTVGCGARSIKLVFDDQILDQAGNLSEPVRLIFSCPGSQKNISLFLIIGFVAGMGLLAVAAWLLVRFVLPYRRAQRVYVANKVDLN